MKNNPYESALSQIKKALNFMDEKKSRNILEILSYPKRVLKVFIPVKMDDGVVRIFEGYRSQHNDLRWPFKGGIRFHPDVNEDEVKALSVWMTIKTSVLDLPLGWGKWGIIVNPRILSDGELERLSRWYVQALYKYLGPKVDVPAPDVNTNPKIMNWMMDEYSKLAGVNAPGSFTGKSLSSGGSLGRWSATAQWWTYVLEKILELQKDTLYGKKIAIQGSGNAGLIAGKILSKRGAKIISISDSKWAIYDENGLHIDEIEKIKKEKKSLQEYKKVKNISNKELLELPVDILIPAALENQIHAENAENIQAKIILELANGPVTPEADEILFQKKIQVIPDVLANAGGVTVSYFEQVQNNMNYYWTEQEVDEKLQKKMKKETASIYLFAQEKNISLRESAYILSLTRIISVMKDRGEI